MAGILGGILIDAFLAVANQTSPIGIWQFVASALVGPVAFTSPWYAALGFVMHFLISSAWGLAYALVAAGPIPALVRHPWIGGIGYGVVVLIGMTFLLAIKHVGAPGVPDTPVVVKSLVANTLFFGLPVALYAASALRRSPHGERYAHSVTS